jgi:hypothetical protein
VCSSDLPSPSQRDKIRDRAKTFLKIIENRDKEEDLGTLFANRKDLQYQLNDITDVIPTNRRSFLPSIRVSSGHTLDGDAFGRKSPDSRIEEASSSGLSDSITLSFIYDLNKVGALDFGLTHSSWTVEDIIIESNGNKFVRKAKFQPWHGFMIDASSPDEEQYFTAFQNSIYSAMGIERFKQFAAGPDAIVYLSFDGLDWADEFSKEDFLEAVEWISKQKSIEMSDDKRKELARLIKIARSQKLGNPNAFKPAIFLRDYDAIEALEKYEEIELKNDRLTYGPSLMKIDFTGPIVSPDELSGGRYYFGESSDGSSRSKRKKISLERRKKLTAEAEKLSAPYLLSTRKREEIRAIMDEVRNNANYYKANPDELNVLIHNIFTRDLNPNSEIFGGHMDEQFLINLGGKDYEIYFDTFASVTNRMWAICQRNTLARYA